MAGHEGCFQMDARLTGHRLGDTQLSCVIGRFAHCQDLAALSHRNGLLLQLANDRVDHFISRAKKADAFFKIVTSCFSCAFSCSSCRILCCSAVSGLPMPGWPFCSAAYCVSQRRIAVWPMLMVSLTFWTLWPCSLIMRTTSSFKLVSNTLRFLVVMFNSLQVVYFPPIEVSGQIRPLQIASLTLAIRSLDAQKNPYRPGNLSPFIFTLSSSVFVLSHQVFFHLWFSTVSIRL